MHTASFQGFIKFIFYLVLFFYAIKFLARIFLPLLVKKAVEKAGQNFQQQYQQQNPAYNNREPHFDNQSKSGRPRETKKVGEYVDYEEID
jgi:hypothetical protein